jgi:two-component system nitrogen regulation response regulator GlnG
MTSNAATLWRWVSEGEGDLVITDVVMPDENAFDMLPRMPARPDLPVMVMSAQNTFMTAIKASEGGAYDYLPKPFDLTEMIGTSAARFGAAQACKARCPRLTTEGMPLVGRSAAMQEIYRVLARLMQTDLTVMITGESGTGKELVARALHDYGKRRNGPFVAINMAAIPRDLIESELFGHEKGRLHRRPEPSTGRFEQAEGGTLFLDEIGDMPMDAQTRLLRVLQQGEYTTVGGRTPIKTDVRIVAATNKDLQDPDQPGPFPRRPFLPAQRGAAAPAALRDRAEDVPDLVRHFVRQAVGEGLDAKRFDGAALDLLKAYPWPGNVRELENVVRRVMALYPQDVITREIIDNELRIESPEPTSPQGRPDGARQRLPSRWKRTCAAISPGFGEDLPPPGLYHQGARRGGISADSRCAYGDARQSDQGRRPAGLNRNTLRKKIRELGVTVYRSPRPA